MTIKTRGIKCVVLILLIISTRAFGQAPNAEDLVKTPASPEAQAFAKYGNTPVNLYTGSPDISIPIAALKGREIEIPVSLTYDASGVKVEQIATWVGLGWNLNVGGMVTRQVNGLPDDYLGNATPRYIPFYSTQISSDYEFVKGFSPQEFSSYNPGDLKRYFDFMQSIVKNKSNQKLEIQPDTYSFNALGLSGTLVIDYATNTAFCIEHPEIKAIPTFNIIGALAIKVITGWTITDSGGNVFHFLSSEQTRVVEQDDSNRMYYSSWLLTKIESKNKRDVINFTYGPSVEWEQDQLAGRGESRNDYINDDFGIDTDNPAPYQYYRVAQSNLQEITVNGKLSARFVASTTNRRDLAGRKSLEGVEIFDQTGTIVSNYKFVHTYFGPTSETDEKLVRLKLDRVEVRGSSFTETPQQYEFQYLPGALPSRESFSQDFWGYHNGAGNSTLIPYNYEFDNINSTTNLFTGADRKPDLTSAKIGTLSKITYPTKGTTEFTYTLHQSADTTVGNYQENYDVAGANLRGGSDPADPFGFIACEPDNAIPPKGISTSFAITAAGDYVITTGATGPLNLSHIGQMQFLALYYAGPLTAPPVKRTFCDLLNSETPPLVRQHNPILPPFSQTLTLNLQPGHYKILILNTDPDVTVSINVRGTRTVNVSDAAVGGLRLRSVFDKDDSGTLVSKKYYYYDDLSKIPSTSITEAYLLGTGLASSGTVHATLNFEDTKLTNTPETGESFELDNGGYTLRYGSNRTQSQNVITYPIVSEVQFSSTSNNHNGFTVYEFNNVIDNYVVGYNKATVLNGKPLGKRVYNNVGTLLQSEQNHYSERNLGGDHAFLFDPILQFSSDLYVKSNVTDPGQEFFVFTDPTKARSMDGPWVTVHCGDVGVEYYLFGDSGYHTSGPHNQLVNCDDWPETDFVASHPARVRYELLEDEGALQVSIRHEVRSDAVEVGRKLYNVLDCYEFGAKYRKVLFNFPQRWGRLDSTRVTEYSSGLALETISKSFYDNTSHYQITRTERKDSKGQWHHTSLSYPHDMLVANPSDPVWTSMIAQNRIAEPVKKIGTLIATAGIQPEYLQNTVYKTIATGSSTMIVPDYVEFALGNGPVEERVRYSQYDIIGNVTEVFEPGNIKLSYLWGYNQLYPVAMATNASSTNISFTSFEDDADKGGFAYSVANEETHVKAGKRSHKLGVQSILRSGLSSSTTYVLSYWAKNGTPSLSVSVQSSNDDAAVGSDGWQYFQKTITGTTQVTISGSANVLIDELRLHPKDAQMKTYTYRPGIGISSMTDENGVTVKYEYDSFGRLIVIRDDKSNILKTFKYNYKQ